MDSASQLMISGCRQPHLLRPTALSYGLARFAYGLQLPHIRDDLALTAAAAGWIGGGAFAAYCVGIAVALSSRSLLASGGWPP
jgi:hypothetical protein